MSAYVLCAKWLPPIGVKKSGGNSENSLDRPKIDITPTTTATTTTTMGTWYPTWCPTPCTPSPTGEGRFSRS